MGRDGIPYLCKNRSKPLLVIGKIWNWEIGKFLLLRQNDPESLWPSERDFPISQFQNSKILFPYYFGYKPSPLYHFHSNRCVPGHFYRFHLTIFGIAIGIDAIFPNLHGI